MFSKLGFRFIYSDMLLQQKVLLFFDLFFHILWIFFFIIFEEALFQDFYFLKYSNKRKYILISMLKVSTNKKLHVVLALYQIKNWCVQKRQQKKPSLKSIEVKTLQTLLLLYFVKMKHAQMTDRCFTLFKIRTRLKLSFYRAFSIVHLIQTSFVFSEKCNICL